MRSSLRLGAPAVLVLAACSAKPNVSIDTDPAPGWTGTAEILIHDAQGALVSRSPLHAHADIAVAPGEIVTVTSTRGDAGPWFETYYGLESGDAVRVPVGIPVGGAGATHTVALHMTAVAGAASTQLAVPGGFRSITGPASGDFVLEVRNETTTVPLLGVALDAQSQVIGAFGSTAVDLTGASATLDQPVATQVVSVLPGSGGLAGDAVWFDSSVFVGDAVLRLDFEKDADPQRVMPSGFGDHAVLEAFWQSATVGEDQFAAAAFDTAPPAQVDLGGSPVSPPAIDDAHFDGARFAFATSGGSGAYDLEWSLGAANPPPGAFWSFVAPPETTEAVLPILPADLAPSGGWSPLQTGVRLGVNNVLDYHSSLDMPSGWTGVSTWLASPGTHYWGARWARMSHP